jgi:hypothetical protein
MRSGAQAYNCAMGIDPGALVFAIVVLIAIELWRARSRAR